MRGFNPLGLPHFSLDKKLLKKAGFCCSDGFRSGHRYNALQMTLKRLSINNVGKSTAKFCDGFELGKGKEGECRVSITANLCGLGFCICTV